ncbi:NarK family nitrate/nitrite MFS transporter [Roseibacillus ishigakijimensis]|uniref:Nitrate/nitrite transporter n=1 Tax=Roseibacillus ishigakijimensis TaxID=454146 RepID=A0A934RM30_9BACT|nr:NarK family nitrate/nitrite MFS transporter [Roseibacillus ishigakijimensis]MBK1833333.1 NarK family nitrate/nitrite MFS transporter [Roseibacillus ishigakijimensis]
MNSSHQAEKLNMLNWGSAAVRTLHFTWFAFFLTFVLWFSHAPMRDVISETFNLTTAQWKALLILNVALTIPARILVGILVDKLGPRLTYSIMLMTGGVLCSLFALSNSYEMLTLTRFLMGFVGAGFVIGIRMVGEWFPAKQVGLAEGIYGGWGNFGSAAAAMLLPTLALTFGGENGWRYALFSISAVAFLYGILFYRSVRNTPKGSTYFKPKKSGGLEVSNKRDFYFLLAMNVPMYAALALLAWKLSPSGVNLLPQSAVIVIYLVLVALFAFQTSQIVKVNKEMLKTGSVPEYQRYSFKQVAILDVNYFITFGSELAVVSMLPGFFADTFGLPMTQAALLASGFAFMNLVARPGGGWLSDKFGRRRTMLILLGGLAVGYLTLGQVNSGWPIALAVLATMCCSFFVQAGEGSVFAMVPLIQRRMTGQIAGMAGAYGNVGAVTFLTIYSFVDASTFFNIIAASSVMGFFASYFLAEPKGHVSEVNEDGTVELIEVA